MAELFYGIANISTVAQLTLQTSVFHIPTAVFNDN